MHSIARNHALVDGNERLAWAATRVFCLLNGRDLILTVDDAEAMVVAVAAGDLDVPALADLVAQTPALNSQLATAAGIPARFAWTKVSTFLNQVRDSRYSQAYDSLCQNDPNLPTRESFVTGLSRAKSRGHAVTSFHVSATFTKETLRLNSAAGEIRFANGITRMVSFDLQPFNAPIARTCIVSYDDLAA